MSSIFEKYAAARAQCPEDIDRIAGEEEHVRKLLELHAYADHPVTQQLLDVCRAQVVELRRKLATDRNLLHEPDAQRDLWSMIDARMWFIELVGKDFQGELQLIEQSLDAELAR